MREKDISKIKRILKKKRYNELSSILDGATGEIDESSTYGSYYCSTVSQYIFYLPLDKYVDVESLSVEDKQQIHDCVLDIYPHMDNAPEIRNIDFRLLPSLDTPDIIESNSEDYTSHEFVKEQLQKCADRLLEEDYDGAISSAGSLLEGVFEDICKRHLSQEIGSTADLIKSFKVISRGLNLSDEQHIDENIKSIMRGLAHIVCGIDRVRNQYGDRHKRTAKPAKRHAKLCVNSVRVLTDFLYETLEYQSNKIGELYHELISLIDGSRRFLGYDEVPTDSEISKHLKKYDIYLKNSIKIKFINTYEITSFRSSDIFFSAIALFINQLNAVDINTIFNNNYNNDQACGLEGFLAYIRREKQQILDKNVVKYLDEKLKQQQVDNEDIDIPF